MWCRQGLSLFFVVGQERKEDDDFDGPADIGPHTWMSMPQNLSRQHPPTTTHLAFSHSRCIIRDALRAQSDSSSWILFTVSSSLFIVSGYLYPGHTHILSAVFLKDAGTHALKNVDSTSTYFLIQELTSVCSLEKASPTYSHGPQKGVHFLLPYL